MRCSVITPLYNSAPYLEACLDSLLAQTVQDFEVILVDDHGQDESPALAQRYILSHGLQGRFRLLSTPCNSGPGVARNLGIEAAQGDYIAFIDSDDLWEPTFLEQLLQAATPSPSDHRDLAYCQLRYSDGRIHRNPVLPSGPLADERRRYFLRHFVTFSVCFLFRRQFLLDEQLRFPAFRNSEDTCFLTSCLLVARSIACVDVPLYVYCVHEQSLSTGRNPRKYRQRLSALNQLLSHFRHIRQLPRYADLHLGQYNSTMYLLWLKKGLAQSIRDYLQNNLKLTI